MFFRWTLSVILLLALTNASGQLLTLSRSSRYHIKGHIQHLVDTTGQLAFEDVLHSKNFKIEPLLNFGFDEAAHWFLIEVENTSTSEDWLLEIPFAPLDRIDFYYRQKGKWIHKISGDNFPIRVRDFPYPHPIFKFHVPAGDAGKLFLRIQTTSSVQLPAIVWEPQAFYTRSFKIQVFNGLFYGAMMVMILYQLFLFLSTRDRVSLYYVFTLLAMIHVVSYFQGYSFLYGFPDLPKLNHYMAILTGPVFLVFSTWLTRAFLNLPKTNPWIDKLLIVNVSLDVVAGLLMVLSIGDLSYRFHHYAILVHSALALVAAGFGIYHRFRPALFYLLSWLTLLVAAVIFSMSNLGLFKGFFSTSSSGLIIACLLQMLFISFALGNRWNMMVKENQHVKEIELRRKQKEKEHLEELVQLRTEEIRQKNSKLEEVNRIKDKLFSIVSHDIKGPLTSLQLALILTKDKTINQEEFQELTHALETRFNQTTEFIENLLQWASLQLKGGIFNPVKVDLCEITRDTVRLLDFDITNKKINVRNEVTQPCYAFTDLNMIRSVMKNLITNAIKFSRKGDTVTIRAKTEDNTIVLSVTDTGVGIPKAHRDKIFSLDSISTVGTKQEKGTGLGLHLAKEFVEKNGGNIWFESEEGIGTVFYFSLPLYIDQTVNEPS